MVDLPDAKGRLRFCTEAAFSLRKSVEIIAHRCSVVLLDDLYDDRAVRLLGLLHDLILCVVALHVFLVGLYLFLDLFDGIKVIQTVLQRKVQGLADAGRFYSFHVLLSNPKEVLSPQITALQRPILIIKNAKNKCKGDSSQKAPLHLLVKITMRL